MHYSETNQILKSKFNCLIGSKVKLSPALTSESPGWGVGIVQGYIPSCDEDEQDYVSIDFDVDDSYSPENAWLVPGQFIVVQD